MFALVTGVQTFALPILESDTRHHARISMRPTLFLTLASAALLSAACTRTPAPVDAATPSSPASAPAEPAATEAPSSSQAATPAAPTVHLALRSEERRVGQRVSVSVDSGGRRTIKKKKQK